MLLRTNICASKNCFQLSSRMSKILSAPQELNPLGFEMHLKSLVYLGSHTAGFNALGCTEGHKVLSGVLGSSLKWYHRDT